MSSADLPKVWTKYPRFSSSSSPCTYLVGQIKAFLTKISSLDGWMGQDGWNPRALLRLPPAGPLAQQTGQEGDNLGREDQDNVDGQERDEVRLSLIHI